MVNLFQKFWMSEYDPEWDGIYAYKYWELGTLETENFNTDNLNIDNLNNSNLNYTEFENLFNTEYWDTLLAHGVILSLQFMYIYLFYKIFLLLFYDYFYSILSCFYRPMLYSVSRFKSSNSIWFKYII